MFAESHSQLPEGFGKMILYCFVRNIQCFRYVTDRSVFMAAHSKNLLTFFG